MELLRSVPVLDGILDQWRAALGEDFDPYRNHCYRVLNFCLALRWNGHEEADKASIAAAFHDLGIWMEKTFDYLAPSKHLAREFLIQTGRESWADEIEAAIEHHHKLTSYSPVPDCLVEAFRRADWIDVSRGRLRFGLPGTHIAAVMEAFPNAGFHRLLLALTWRRWWSHPLSPLPMMRW